MIKLTEKPPIYLELYEALAHFTSFTVAALWDGEAGHWATLTMGELLPFSGPEARWALRCSLTEHP